MTNNQDAIFMNRCLELASLGKSDAAPNPMVGSVIVHNNKIIGEGYHQKYGEAHAEVNAINSVKDRSLLTSATLYVNLEPCAHYGKTPPCALLIKECKIPRVVIGCVDPFAKVAGKGIAILREAGVEVAVGVLEKESLALNKRFITFHEKKRPYIILKWAESADGFIDGFGEKPMWLTNDESRCLVHKMRAEEAAIMVGTTTAIKDNPSLTTRAWSGPSPVRVALDRQLKIPATHQLLDGSTRTIIFTQESRESYNNTEFVTLDYSEDIISQCLDFLYKEGLNSLIVEGGAKLINSFIEQDLWEEAWQYIGQVKLIDGINSPKLTTTPDKSLDINNTVLNVYNKIKE